MTQPKIPERVKIPVETIEDNPFQPRERYTEIETLAAKIAAMKDQLPDTLGLIHVPNARRQVDGTVQLAEGHRRLRAFRHLAQADPDYAEMPLNLVNLSDDDMDDIAWSENRDRKDLSPVEEARALKRTLESRSITQAELAALRHLGRSTVANKIRLLNLPDDMLDAVDDGRVSERQAIDLLPALEIKSSDMDGAGLTKDLYFTAGASWSVPTPNTLKKRILEQGDLTGDQVRRTVELIKQKVEQAKLDRWRREQGDRPAEAPDDDPDMADAPPPPPPTGAVDSPEAPPRPPLPDVRAQTSDDEPDTESDPEPEPDDPDWLQPDADNPPAAPTAAPDPKPVAPPPPPPAPKPAPKPTTRWQMTVSFTQEGAPVNFDTPVMVSLFKSRNQIAESVSSNSGSYGELDALIADLLKEHVPVEIPF